MIMHYINYYLCTYLPLVAKPLGSRQQLIQLVLSLKLEDLGVLSII